MCPAAQIFVYRIFMSVLKKTCVSNEDGTPEHSIMKTLISLQETVSWDLAPCNPTAAKRYFWITYRLHLQGRGVRQAKSRRQAEQTRAETGLVCLLPARVTFLPGTAFGPEDGSDVSPKCWLSQDTRRYITEDTTFLDLHKFKVSP
jgi:hypothetical protein